MRILLFPASYAPIVGGLQTVAQTLARSFKEQGHEVCVITNRYPMSLPAKEIIDGVTIERLLLLGPDAGQLRRKRPDLFFASLYYSPTSYWQLKDIIRRFRPDVVNVHFPDHQIPFVLKLRTEFDFRLVVSLHGHDIMRASNGHKVGNGMDGSGRSAKALRKLRAILKRADAITACSGDLLNEANRVEPTISGKSQVIHNGIDPARFQDDEPYSHPRPYILAVGRLTHNKGFHLLIEAFAQHQSEIRPDLIIAGAGEERDSLRAQVEQLGLSRNVYFVGQCSPKEIVRLLNGSLLVVVPSVAESFGIAALEAMAAGKVVLATKVGGLPELVHESTNKLVDPSVAGLTLGLTQCLALSGQLSERGLANRKIAAKFTWTRTVEQYLHLYQETAAAGQMQATG